MGAAIGFLVGTVVAVLLAVFVWAPLLGATPAEFVACFFTGFILSGIGMALGSVASD